jgi:hypothetical protein
MELYYKIRDLIRDNPESKFFFILAIVMTIVLQVVIYNQYNDIVRQLDEFVKVEIENEAITNIKTRAYKPGRGNYKSIQISNDKNKEYPILLTGLTDYRLSDLIDNGSIIRKSSYSRDFIIIKENKEFEFRLMNLKDQMFILMTIGFIISAGGTIFATVMVTLKKSVG